MEQRYKEWLAWVNNRMQALDEIDEKLIQMQELAEQAKSIKVNYQQLAAINQKFKILEEEVRSLDERSRKYTTN